jgi:hypothetical protein
MLSVQQSTVVTSYAKNEAFVLNQLAQVLSRLIPTEESPVGVPFLILAVSQRQP